jgi:hypothetical protein
MKTEKEVMLNSNRHRFLVTERGNILIEAKETKWKWKTLFCLWNREGDIEKMEEAIKYGKENKEQ